ncbi:hypothetical protein BB560_002880 [Smittium megazygosporum]|uniref:Imidazole glycerol phosphate synthase hisHF n=1 Tax=Smittium megazygosporum TaxID=133381 RepID=A0A2T9ZDK2_9FUNG|nr:hypothetical protein BB560_002880 [Smittium megazygosporum]
MQDADSQGLFLLDYGAGNVRSVYNAIELLGYSVKIISSPEDFHVAKKIIFPGVGSFSYAMDQLSKKNLIKPLLEYIASGKPLMGICVGMQVLFESSEESDKPGLGIFKGIVRKFSNITKSVPLIGWNSCTRVVENELASNNNIIPISQDGRFYFVHSYATLYDPSTAPLDAAYTTTRYGDQTFLSSIYANNIFATQFHPEKSGKDGLNLIKSFITSFSPRTLTPNPIFINPKDVSSSYSLRIIACMDIRNNDENELVVTKGDQYDVRDTSDSNKVRNMGNPVQLAKRYFTEGADEITFLNITSFRDIPLQDLPMLDILREASKHVFVPMTIGGGIRSITSETTGETWSAVEVANAYFMSGADKISIGSDSVYAVEEYLKNSKRKSGLSSIEQISEIYGSQAVVVSVDPKRAYVSSPSESKHNVIKTNKKGPNGEEYCWFQCTVKGGREARDIDVVELCTAVEDLGAGEILLNSIDNDGCNSGYDIELLKLVKSSVTIPVIASSGAGNPSHFLEASKDAGVDAVLAAGIFHRHEVEIKDAKSFLNENGISVRI